MHYKTCRELAGLTQEEALYGLPRIKEVSTLSRYENGHLPVPDEVVYDMAILYRNKDLVTWHIRRCHPLFAEYVPYPTDIHNDYEFALRSEFAANKLSETANSIKEYLENDGKFDGTERSAIREKMPLIQQAITQYQAVLKYIDKMEGEQK